MGVTRESNFGRISACISSYHANSDNGIRHGNLREERYISRESRFPFHVPRSPIALNFGSPYLLPRPLT